MARSASTIAAWCLRVLTRTLCAVELTTGLSSMAMAAPPCSKAPCARSDSVFKRAGCVWTTAKKRNLSSARSSRSGKGAAALPASLSEPESEQICNPHSSCCNVSGSQEGAAEATAKGPRVAAVNGRNWFSRDAGRLKMASRFAKATACRC